MFKKRMYFRHYTQTNKFFLKNIDLPILFSCDIAKDTKVMLNPRTSFLAHYFEQGFNSLC